MTIDLEDRIRDAILSLRFQRACDGIDPRYFHDAPPEPIQFEESAATFLARFIANRVGGDCECELEAAEKDLDKYSPEVIASYLEDQGYIVTSPD